jgi:hypothetical protein
LKGSPAADDSALDTLDVIAFFAAQPHDHMTLAKHLTAEVKRTKQRQVKGHFAELEAMAQALCTGGEAPISWPDLYAVSLATILAVRSLREGWRIDLAEYDSAAKAPSRAAA